MLLAFRVANHRSFRDEQSLSLLRSARMLDLEAEVDAWDPLISTTLGIYGANASGKSNMLKAISFLADAVTSSHQRWKPDARINRRSFLLDDECSTMPSLLEIEFRHLGLRYQYGFEVNDERFIREWLYAYRGSRRQTWFERDASGGGDSESSWYFGKTLTGQNRVIADLTRPNSLFLSAAAANKHEKLAPANHWITRNLRFANPENYTGRLQFTLGEVERRGKSAAELQGLLRFADLGICGFKIEKQDFDEATRGRIVGLAKLLATTGKSANVKLEDESSSEALDDDSAWRDALENVTRIELEHRRGDGSVVRLPFSSESTGTQAIVALAGPVFQCLRNGYALLVDEIDTSLHPSLVAHLIRIFQDSAVNPHQAQLVFTSHDTSLLGTVLADEPLLARDQVWFVQKNEHGASQIYPLTEFKPRKLENLERGYLQGRYGAVPFLDAGLLAPVGLNVESE